MLRPYGHDVELCRYWWWICLTYIFFLRRLKIIWLLFDDYFFLKHKNSYKLINSVDCAANGEEDGHIDQKIFGSLDIKLRVIEVFGGIVRAKREAKDVYNDEDDVRKSNPFVYLHFLDKVAPGCHLFPYKIAYGIVRMAYITEKSVTTQKTLFVLTLLVFL